MLKAHFPLLYLTTSEYNRVMQKVRKIAFDGGYAFHTWDCVTGLHTHIREDKTSTIKKHTAHDETMDCETLLEYLYNTITDDSNEDDESRKEIFVLEDFHRYFEREKIIVSLRKLSHRMMDAGKHIIFLSPFYKLPSEIEKYITVLTIPLPGRSDLEKRLLNICDSNTINNDLKKYIIDAALGLTDTEANLAFRLAQEKCGLNTREAITIIANEKEQIIKKSGILDYFQTNMDLARNVGGLSNLKSWLKQRSKAFESRAKEFGLTEPKGILLLGVPGCGKSLTAKCIATEWKQPLLRLDIGKVFQAEVGSSENNIRQAIVTAEAVAPCVLWIDEIEKGLSASGGEHDGGTNSRVFSTILTWMQEKTKPVFVVATANDISQLPPEFLRKGRFDEIFFVDLPTADERKDIFKIHLAKHRQEGIRNLDRLVELTKYFNGAEIEESIKDAMFIAYVQDANEPKVTSAHLEEAIGHIIPLAKTMNVKITGLRQWAKQRARLASSIPNDEELDNTSMQECIRTKRERSEDIF